MARSDTGIPILFYGWTVRCRSVMSLANKKSIFNLNVNPELN